MFAVFNMFSTENNTRIDDSDPYTGLWFAKSESFPLIQLEHLFLTNMTKLVKYSEELPEPPPNKH